MFRSSHGSSDEPNPYKILGVTKKSTDKEIKDAYYKLSLQHHPDKSADGNDTEMKDIVWAKEILLDPNDRKMYNSDGLMGVKMKHYLEDVRFGFGSHVFKPFFNWYTR